MSDEETEDNYQNDIDLADIQDERNYEQCVEEQTIESLFGSDNE